VSVGASLERLVAPILIKYWRWRDPPTYDPPKYSMNPSDNVQVPMNLIMPLKDASAIGRAELAKALLGSVEQVVAGLNNTEIVHFGRFTIVDGNLVMFSIYDGDFGNYIRDFIYNVGTAFDGLLAFVKDPPPLPVESDPDAFIEWVRRHDALQMPENVTDLSDDVLRLPRDLAITLADNDNVQLFVYRAYPSFSAAQIRDALDLGW
jgi:hypothetical protein